MKSSLSITQILVMLLGMIILLFSAFGYYSIDRSGDALRKSVEHGAMVQVETVAQKIKDYIRFQNSMWSAYSKSLMVVQALKKSNKAFSSIKDVDLYIEKLDRDWRAVPEGRTSAVMDNLMSSRLAKDMRLRLKQYEIEYGYPLFAEIFLTNKYGGNVAQTNRTSDYQQNDEEWWQVASTKGLHIGDVDYDDSAKMYATSLSLKVVGKGGEFLGVMKVVLNVEEVRQILDMNAALIKQFSESQIILLNGDDLVVHHTGRKIDIMEDGSRYLQPFESSDGSSAVFTNTDSGQKSLGLIHSMNAERGKFSLPWKLLVTYDYNQVFGATSSLKRNMVVTGLLTSLLAVFLGSSAIVKIKNRFSKINHAALDLASGNFRTRINPSGKDEVSKLSRTFDFMATELEALTDDLEKEKEEALNKEKRKIVTLSAAKVAEWEYHPHLDKLVLPKDWSHQLGLDSFGEEPESFLSQINGTDKEEFLGSLRSLKKAENNIIEYALPIKDNDGRNYWVLAKGQIIDPFLGIIAGILVDITAQKELEQRLSQSNRLQSIGSLAAGIAHEINTPMQYIGDNLKFLKKGSTRIQKFNGYCEEFFEKAKSGVPLEEVCLELKQIKKDLRIDKVNSRVPEAIDDSLDGVAAVSRIVSAMKDFSHPDHKNKVETDLNSVIESAVDVCRNEWKYVADLEKKLAGDLSKIPAYSGELNQVFLNIVVNAAHAVEERLNEDNEKGLIIIETKDNLTDGVVEVSISDNGLGIPFDLQEKVFDQFFTTKGVGRGTGQGLSICRSIVVNRHGGDIRVSSEPGKGSTFTVILPKEDINISKEKSSDG